MFTANIQVSGFSFLVHNTSLIRAGTYYFSNIIVITQNLTVYDFYKFTVY